MVCLQMIAKTDAYLSRSHAKYSGSPPPWNHWLCIPQLLPFPTFPLPFSPPGLLLPFRPLASFPSLIRATNHASLPRHHHPSSSLPSPLQLTSSSPLHPHTPILTPYIPTSPSSLNHSCPLSSLPHLHSLHPHLPTLTSLPLHPHPLPLISFPTPLPSSLRHLQPCITSSLL